MSKIFLFLALSFLFLVYPAGGITLTISPENPVAGDEITIRGSASPNEVLRPSVSFEKTVSVTNGKYDYRLYGVKIPSGENNFAVTAKNVNNLNVRVKMLLWWTRSADAANGIATVSQGNVPSGTYDIRIDGHAADKASSVPLMIAASSKITADANGNFEYRYSSAGIPPGTFTLSIGGTTKTISLNETRVPAATVNPTQTSTPAAIPITASAAVVTPTITPAKTPVVTPISNATASAATPIVTSIPVITTPSIATTTTVPMPAEIPGFEIVFAIIALMVLRWKKLRA